MRRRLLTTAIALLATFVGCRSRQQQLDPFIGRTTVPAPVTGSVGTQAPAYTYPAAPPTISTPPAGTTSPFPSGGSLYSPPGGFVPNNSSPTGSAPPPTSPIASTPAVTPQPSTQFAGASGAGGSPIRILEPAATSGAGGTTVARPAALPAAAAGVDIMSLPVSNRPVPTGVQQSFQQPPGALPPGIQYGAAQTATINPAPTDYGFNDNYSRLAGRLEYSPSDGRWMLRYVAPGNVPDRFGGVVMVAVQSAAGGLRHGDFVVADGRLDPSTSGMGYPPVFTAMNVQPQRR